MTRMQLRRLFAGCALITALAFAGCGGSSGAAKSASTAAPSDAKSAATGDIPDNQAFLTFHDPVGYSIAYPEGWARRGAGADVTFQDKANNIRIVVGRGSPPTPETVRAALARLAGTDPSLAAGKPQPVTLKHSAAVKVSYTRQGGADPVTGKRPLLIVDRYVFGRAGRVATVDLATVKGVDNVDAYRMISRSFTWR
jgi:hypothetical protein